MPAGLPAREVEARQHGLGGAPPVLGVLLGPPGPRRGQRVLGFLAREDVALGGDRQALGGGGPDVDSDEDGHVSRLATGGEGSVRQRLWVSVAPPPPSPAPGCSGDNGRNNCDLLPERLTGRSPRWPRGSTGNITRRQLLDLGLNRRHDRLPGEDRAAAPRLSAACTRSAGLPLTPHEWASAAVLAAGADAPQPRLGDGALGVLAAVGEPFEVTVVGDRRTNGIRVHRSTTLRWRDVTRQLGIRVTTPARTLLDMSPRLSDKSLKRHVNNALNSPWLTEDQLAETLARHPTGAGSGAHRQADRPRRARQRARAGRTSSRSSATHTGCRRR